MKGFTLLDLMICIAIVGILAAIAGPTYDRFQAKARNTEARIALGAIFVAEESYLAETSSYTACLADIGYAPGSPTRYFRVGFSATQATGMNCGPSGNQACNQTGWPLGGGAGKPCAQDPAMTAGQNFVYPATALMPGAPAIPTDTEMPQSLPLSKGYFVASAVSNSPLIADLSFDLFEAQALADGDTGSNGGGNNNGSTSSSSQTNSNQNTQSCTQTSVVWTIDSSGQLVLGRICN
jgi:type IV pilus assembly protein PilA